MHALAGFLGLRSEQADSGGRVAVPGTADGGDLVITADGYRAQSSRFTGKEFLGSDTLRVQLVPLFDPNAPGGRLTVIVRDAANDSLIAGANVIVIGTRIGAMTGSDGSAELPDVPAREVTILVMAPGGSKEVWPVPIRSGGADTTFVKLRRKLEIINWD